MIFIESDSTNPYYNLALEEYVFEQMDRRKEYFILWQNAKTVVVGKYQNTVEEINKEYVDAHGIRVARRLSGGGAVYHDLGNLNFTFVVGREKNPEFDFSLFSGPVVQALAQFGVQAEINGRNDISIHGKKFSGNSQYTKKNRLLHHGCIMLDTDLAMVSRVLQVKPAKFESKSVKSVQSRVTAINDQAPRPIGMEEFKEALKACAFAGNTMERYHLTLTDQMHITKLQKEKYETWEWNYGKNPACNMSREMKFPTGLVQVKLLTEHGRIQKIRFFGDFFGTGEIGELEQQLEGAALDLSLKQRLETLQVPYYMHGITAEDLCRLIL